MTDDARRPLNQEERTRIKAARYYGDACSACGRALSGDEPVWIDRLYVGAGYDGRGAVYWLGPVGRECASPELLRATEGHEPRRCANCRRAVYYRSEHPLRRLVMCSRRCGVRAATAQRKGGRVS